MTILNYLPTIKRSVSNWMIQKVVFRGWSQDRVMKCVSLINPSIGSTTSFLSELEKIPTKKYGLGYVCCKKLERRILSDAKGWEEAHTQLTKAALLHILTTTQITMPHFQTIILQTTILKVRQL
jgi:hypothetical protein